MTPDYNRINELLGFMKVNNINGWVNLRAKMVFDNKDLYVNLMNSKYPASRSFL